MLAHASMSPNSSTICLLARSQHLLTVLLILRGEITQTAAVEISVLILVAVLHSFHGFLTQNMRTLFQVNMSALGLIVNGLNPKEQESGDSVYRIRTMSYNISLSFIFVTFLSVEHDF